MKDDLALSLLTTVTGDEDLQRIATLTAEFQALAAVKYDAYEGYRPGVKFVESLAVWLNSFAPEERKVALAFVRSRLVYVSAPEIDRLISTVYPDLLRPHLLQVAADEIGLPAWRVAGIAGSPEFRSLQRRMLLLGMSDGARLDRLRRASPLSTEQFHLVTQLDEGRAKEMRDELEKALIRGNLPGEPTFGSVVLVDDFAASGTTMIRPAGNSNSAWKGKLVKARDRLDRLREIGVVHRDAGITILIYLMTSRANDHLIEGLQRSGLAEAGFRLVHAHIFDDDLPLRDPQDGPFLGLCRVYCRQSWENEHTQVGGDEFALGYGSCAIPVILHHNTPNNSPPILWRDEMVDPTEESQSELPWVGLFPRHERHHPRRP